MAVLITGGTGFVGGYLRNYLEKDSEVYVSSRYQMGPHIIQLNLLDIEGSKKILAQHKFDKIFHLTSQSSVQLSIQRPFDTIFDNVNTTVNLLKIVHEMDYECKIVLASTSEVYKGSTQPLTEENGFEPRHPYAISKIVTDYLVRNLSTNIKLNVTLLRLFNHTGPGQADSFVLGSFSRQIAEIMLGLKPPVIKVGNLDAQRDFVDVRDVCRAYDLAGNKKEHGEVYNVCSGKAFAISELLNKLINFSGIKVEIEQDPNRLRPSDIPVFLGNYNKIKNSLGWEPAIPIDQTLQEMLNWWVENLRN